MRERIASAGLLVGLALPATGVGATLAECSAIADDRLRLACYDEIARPARPSAIPSIDAAAPAPAMPSPGATPRPQSATVSAPAPASTTASGTASALEQQWELRPDLRRGTFVPRPYRPLYALVHATTGVNGTPTSPTRPTAVDDIRLDRYEAKLQLSFKAKVFEDLFGTSTDAWFGYTQVSYWQAGNGRYSSPFRETNYQPEAILIRPLQISFGELRLRYLGAAFVHESNGRSSALSRSWNRIVGDAGIEYGPWSFNVRPWMRTDFATGDNDDNPDIKDYVGRGEIVAAYRSGRRQVVTLTGRHTLRGGDRSRGSLRLDIAFPLTGALDAHVQVFTGYGESLIDYNHRQTTLGIGLSFFD